MTGSGEDFVLWLREQLDAAPRGTKSALAKAVPGLDSDKLSKILAGTRRPQFEEAQAIRAYFMKDDADGFADTPEAPISSTADSTYTNRSDYRRIAELDLKAMAGLGGPDLEISIENEREAVVGFHTYPALSYMAMFGTAEDRVRIIEVIGDSMVPTLFPGQRVAVDLSDKSPSPPGIFIVHDGLSLLCKRIELIPHSDPFKVIVTSDNPRYKEREMLLEEAHIAGRVIGAWSRT